MKISALATGSSGNCYYIENEINNKKQGILVDAGISCKQICERLQDIKAKPENIKAIFLTHEHSDHIKGTDVFARKFNVPIFATKKLSDSKFVCKNSDLIKNIKNDETTKIIGLEINSLPKSHLAIEPVFYSILFPKENKKLSIITDAGHACKNIIESVSDSNFLCFESNYDEKMLDEGFYPYPTKKWIKSDQGHLSNTQSASCILEHANKRLKHLMLCHISANNNTPEIALKTHNYFLKQRADIKPLVSLSLRSSTTPLFRI